MVIVVDYGMGNLGSVRNAFDAIGVPVRLVDHPAALDEADHVVLPGVGAFGEAMRRLGELGFRDALERAVLGRRKPLLGICLGMELLAERSYEHGEHRGLGWIPGEVVRIAPSDPSLRVPHVGWNEVERRAPSPLYAGLPPAPSFYFVHSYRFAADPASVTAVCDHGGELAASVARGHVHGVQFHPEKSHQVGLALLRNFAALPSPAPAMTGEPSAC